MTIAIAYLVACSPAESPAEASGQETTSSDTGDAEAVQQAKASDVSGFWGGVCVHTFVQEGLEYCGSTWREFDLIDDGVEITGTGRLIYESLGEAVTTHPAFAVTGMQHGTDHVELDWWDGAYHWRISAELDTSKTMMDVDLFLENPTTDGTIVAEGEVRDVCTLTFDAVFYEPPYWDLCG